MYVEKNNVYPFLVIKKSIVNTTFESGLLGGCSTSTSQHRFLHFTKKMFSDFMIWRDEYWVCVKCVCWPANARHVESMWVPQVIIYNHISCEKFWRRVGLGTEQVLYGLFVVNALQWMMGRSLVGLSSPKLVSTEQSLNYWRKRVGYQILITFEWTYHNSYVHWWGFNYLTCTVYLLAYSHILNSIPILLGGWEFYIFPFSWCISAKADTCTSLLPILYYPVLYQC